MVKKDPTPSSKRELKKLLSTLRDNNKISNADYQHLTPTEDVIPRMYCTPKVHKPGIPLRPIVDCTGSPTYMLSKALVTILRPLMGKNPQHCKNSKHLAEELNTVRVEHDEEIISHDVVCLFSQKPP